ncbi:MAG: RNA polymerase sigma factor [Candidatus Binatia bacterium]
MENGPTHDLKDEDLVALCQKGERQPFEVLVRRYMQKAFRIALDFTHDREEARDLSQEAFLRAFLCIKQFKGKSSFYTWFYRIVVNLCLDHNRRRGRISREPFDEESHKLSENGAMTGPSFSPHEEVVAEEAGRKMGVVLDALPKNQRTAFLLRNHQGLSITDIAKVMQTTEGTVRVYLHRAVATLRQSLAEPA